MLAELLAEIHVVGLSAILVTIERNGPLPRNDVVELCRGYGLRAGAIPWSAAMLSAETLRLVERRSDGAYGLSQVGRGMCDLLGGDPEPSDAFCQAMTLAAVVRDRRIRIALTRVELQGGSLRDTTGLSYPLLGELADTGLLEPSAEEGWHLGDSDLTPLLVGVLLGSTGSTAAKEVGDVGELLGLRYLQEEGWQAIHVSPLSDAFGFDILGHSPPNGGPSKAVETKATSERERLTFHLSAHQVRVAARLGPRYEIQVWGAVDRGSSVDDNYRRLRGNGYPRAIPDPVGRIRAARPEVLDGADLPDGLVAAEGLCWSIDAPLP